MEIEIHLKDPDALIEAFNNGVEEMEHPVGLSYEEYSDLKDSRAEKWREECGDKYFEYGEYITLIYDTETQGIKVKEN